MMQQRGFALFEVLLAVILMAIAAAGSYALVKSFRVNSATQQVVNYATTITQNFIPFLDGGSATTVLTASTDTLSSPFLSSIGIPATDQVTSSGAACAGATASCYVKSGMYVTSGGKSIMSFDSVTNSTQNLASYFAIALQATGAQVNQILQSSSSLFSVYCAASGSALAAAGENCVLKSKDDANTTYSLFLVFPKTSAIASTLGIDLTPKTAVTT